MQLLRVSTAKHHREGLLDISGVVHAKYMANPSESLHPKVRDEVKSLFATCAPGRNLDDTFGGGCVAPAHGTIDGWWVGEVTEVQALALLETPLAE